MTDFLRTHRALVATAAGVAVIALMFTAAYTIAPNYYNNQHYYFLNAFAQADGSSLSGDWMSHTADPTPVFTALIAATQKYGWPGLYYVYQAILYGIYIFSLTGLIAYLFDVKFFSRTYWLFVILITFLHSKLFIDLTSAAIHADSGWHAQAGVAGQSILSNYLQPSMFDVLLVFSLWAFLANRYVAAGLAIALAATFHPSILIAGCFLTMGYLLALILRKNYRGAFRIGLSALIGVVPISLYVYSTFTSSSTEVANAANYILAHIRAPHHAIPASWQEGMMYIQLATVCGALWLTRKTKLFIPILVPTILGVLSTMGIALAMRTGINVDGLALTLPWRISILLIPVSSSIISAWILLRVYSKQNQHSTRHRSLSLALALVVLAASVGYGTAVTRANWIRRSADPANSLFAFVRGATPATYVIPVDLEAFRLETNQPVLVDYKSVPFIDTEILEWYARLNDAKNFYAAQGGAQCALAARLKQRYGIARAVVLAPKSDRVTVCPTFKMLYEDLMYAVYNL